MYNTPGSDSEKNRLKLSALRTTDQFILPLKNSHAGETYAIYPATEIEDPVYEGFESLASWIKNKGGPVILDGYSGVLWDHFREQLSSLFAESATSVSWIDIRTCYKPAAVIDALLLPYLNGNDPLFGRLYPGELEDFFDLTALGSLQTVPGTITILYGTGAALAGWKAPLIYTDVPKNEIQFRSRAGQVAPLGYAAGSTPGGRLYQDEHSEPVEDAKLQYKRFYFIDWPVLNRFKQRLLPLITVFADEQRITTLTWTTGDSLRKALHLLTRNVFRARPWFEPGIWGGNWIKDRIPGLNRNVPNYAWSFELISPENGVLIGHKGLLLEFSFDMLLFYDNQAILGLAASRFGMQFPIRFDLLDTMNGGNLSLQCHPAEAYIKEQFGENFTQDETYYILEAEPEALVYLGFQEEIDKEEFRTVLSASFAAQEPLEIGKYIRTFPSNRHDLFLIPSGTVHCSGSNNLVLEISATPYIYTFKMYDWIRADLNGQPRTLNLDRAFENLDFSRRGQVVTETLISRQSVASKEADHTIVSLSTHPEHFYGVERLEFDSSLEVKTNGQCHILSLVEGESVLVITSELELKIHFAETFIIPAAATSYILINEHPERAKVIKAFVKDEAI